MTGQFAWESSKGRSHLGLRGARPYHPFLHPHGRVEWATFSCCVLFYFIFKPFSSFVCFSPNRIFGRWISDCLLGESMTSDLVDGLAKALGSHRRCGSDRSSSPQ
ncbi:hypothetical protein CEXT_686551 [Caerostris extrusa]|uniref:Uncharacterized protein n=1 Tax=Caerostris extrusa TaxID=172846 RepID=A0AAV4VAW4_CAEEX|nr:hypothetical protein CEXT_686551 [Caerostris extrusa]